jgi:glycosyltransferase involved in cell wall biosynthesis
MQDTLDIIIPVYNEEECITSTYARLKFVQNHLSSEANVNLIFINDGSYDNSPALLFDICKSDESTKLINFSRNFGHQISITAGLDFSEAKYVAIIDADLQDPPELIIEMYTKAKQGYDIIYGKRIERKGETLFKKITAYLFYSLISKLCSIDIPMHTGDFRLINKKVADALKQMPEKHRFVRGMVPWVGFKSTPVYYNRDERIAGKTKYPFRKMLNFALDAIFSFSTRPLKISSYIGLLMIIFSLALSVFMLYIKLFTDLAVEGVTVIVWIVALTSGCQIFILGILGEYIARIFEESKRRPLYIIDSTCNLS